MGKVPFYTDSEDTENTDAGNSSIENFKKKKYSILKYTENTNKKKKCRIHSKSEPDDSDFRSRSLNSEKTKKTKKLRGILKHDKDSSRERVRQREKERERERELMSTASEDDEEPIEAPKPHMSREKYLVGRVPRPPGTKPGRGGGVAIIVRRHEELKPPVVMSPKDSAIYVPKSKKKWLSRKKSF